jgi:hypothetical protein
MKEDINFTTKNTLKTCSKCGTKYPSTFDFFYRRKTTKDGLDSWCKKCKQMYDAERNQKKRLYKYNLTSKEYENILRNQNNKCAICGVDFDYLRRIKKDSVPKTSKPRIDHNHRTGEVRGLLCSDCNIMLGCFKDNPLIIINAIKYLKGYQK